MHTVEQLQQRIATAIAQTDLAGQPAELYDPITYILQLGGKRIRPVLLLMAGELFDGNVEELIAPALGIEVFHNFTLLHDDIMDKAPLRRGQPTAHEKWNANIAILSGDTMFVKACQLMAETPVAYLKPVLDMFYRTAIAVCEGQQLDMNFESRANVSIMEYENMIALKTSVLLAAALHIGATIAGAPEADADKLYEFGRCIGIAFQLQDDILDVYGQADKFGKQVGGDILADKKTYLLIKALEIEASSKENQLHSLISGTAVLNDDDKVKTVTAIYNRLDVKQLAEQEMQRWLLRGIDALNTVHAEEERKQPLKNLATMLLSRDV